MFEGSPVLRAPLPHPPSTSLITCATLASARVIFSWT